MINRCNESLVNIETMFSNHLGNNFIREILYSKYGSWLPKYSFNSISNSKVFNPDNISSWSNSNTNLINNFLKNNDWVSYFNYTLSNKNQCEVSFIRKHIIFGYNKFNNRSAIDNFVDINFWKSKKSNL